MRTQQRAKSQRQMLIPRPLIIRWVVEVPLGKNRAVNTSEDAVHGAGYSAGRRAALRGCFPDYGMTFTESLILAQDERWRRA